MFSFLDLTLLKISMFREASVIVTLVKKPVYMCAFLGCVCARVRVLCSDVKDQLPPHLSAIWSQTKAATGQRD